MHAKDRIILRLLQKDATLSMSELAERCSLSKTAVWRRVRDLEKSGMIKQRVTVLDQKAAGFGLTVFAFIKTRQHSDDWYDQFSKAVLSIPEILEFHRASGDIDYLLRIVAKDMADYDRVYRQLIRSADFSDVSSTFIMDSVKTSTELPI